MANIMLERGITPTPYEPYTETVAYVPEVGYSLMNGVTDEIDIGRGVKTQRVGVKTSVSNGTTINYSDMPTDGQFVAYDESGQPFQIGVKGDTLEDDAELLLYQLTTPIETQIAPLTLLAHPNGTIYVEPMVFRFTAKPDESGVITRPYADDAVKDIVEVESVKPIIVHEDGTVEYGEHIAPTSFDGTTITNVAYDADTMYEVVYKGDPSLSTLASVEYSYAMNIAAQVEGNSIAISELNKAVNQLDAFTVAMLLNHEARITILETLGS